MWRLCFFLFLVSAHEERADTDGESSRKVLGSSVVTSVSVIMDTGNGTKYFTDAVGQPVSKPQIGSDIASPIDLLNPDRYEFYTFDDAGDLVKRLMTLDEIHEIIATGDGGDPYILDEDDLDATKSNFLPEKRVNDVVSNVQNVLKEEIKTHQQSGEKPLYDTPDVSDHWSMILPAVFGNSGEDIKPEQPTRTHVTPDTIMIEPQPTISVQIISHSNTTQAVTVNPNDTSQIYEIKPIKNQHVTTFRPTRTTDSGINLSSVRTTPHGFVLTSTTTAKPTTSTRKATTSTRKPISSTRKPISSTRDPTTSIRNPISSTRTPISSTRKPTTSTRKPVTSTRKPTISAASIQTFGGLSTTESTRRVSTVGGLSTTTGLLSSATGLSTTTDRLIAIATQARPVATSAIFTQRPATYTESTSTRRTTTPPATSTERRAPLRTTRRPTTTERFETTTDQLSTTTTDRQLLDESTLTTLLHLLKEGNLPTTDSKPVQETTTDTTLTETTTQDLTTTPEPLSTFFIVSDNTKENIAPSTHKYFDDLNTLSTEYVTSRTKYPTTEITEKPSTLLDQYLLTSTNIYEINSVLSDKVSTFPFEFESSTTDVSSEFTTKSANTMTFEEKFDDFKENFAGSTTEVLPESTRLENAVTETTKDDENLKILSTSPTIAGSTLITASGTEQVPLNTSEKLDLVPTSAITTVSEEIPPNTSTEPSLNTNDEILKDTATVASKLVDSTDNTPHIINITIIQNENTAPETTTTFENTESTAGTTTEISTNPPGDTKWLLISTLAPPPQPQFQETTTRSETETRLPVTDSPTQIDLVPKPLQGFGLEDSTAHLDSDIYQFVQLCNELAFGFWKSATMGLSTARSIVVSPFAATSLLAMVFLGARGATSGEMNEILKLDDMVTFNPHLIFKNVTQSILGEGVAVSALVRELYSDRGKGKLLSFYKERVRQFYDGHVEEASFREIGDVIRRRTNLLVKKETGGKIQEFLRDGSIVPRAPLAGVSVSIFQTDCSQGSVGGRDGEIHFVVSPSIRQRRLVPIPATVYRTNFLAGYEPSLDATAAALGTKDHTVTTIFLMPGQQASTAPGDGLLRLEKHLIESGFRKGAWARLLRSLIPRPGLELQIPRFQHRSLVNATQTLKKMGLHELFDARKADLKGLNGAAHELHLSDVLQINEFATCGEGRMSDGQHHKEIYPATVSLRRRRVLIKADSTVDYRRAFHDPLHDPTDFDVPLNLRPRQARVPEVPRLRFDRPFLYFVRHNPTGLILHMGRFHPRLLP